MYSKDKPPLNWKDLKKFVDSIKDSNHKIEVLFNARENYLKDPWIQAMNRWAEKASTPVIDFAALIDNEINRIETIKRQKNKKRSKKLSPKFSGILLNISKEAPNEKNYKALYKKYDISGTPNYKTLKEGYNKYIKPTDRYGFSTQKASLYRLTEYELIIKLLKDHPGHQKTAETERDLLRKNIENADN